MNSKLYILFILGVISLASCRKDVGTPVITSVSPEFGPVETLVTIEGANLADIQQITFNDQIINFNTAYNADNALLMRIPTDVPLGDYVVTLRTEGGEVKTNFRVSEDVPEVFSFAPASAAVGEEVVIKGENFFEPLQVWFFDSIPANIVTFSADSIVVQVPSGVEKGRISLQANGGFTRSPINFFTVNPILVNDFDGNGSRAETDKWIFVGGIDQNKNNAVQNRLPEPLDGFYLKLSGRDDLDISWIGGAENHTWDPAFETFEITTDANNTLLEMDLNNNGRKQTNLILVLLEKDGSPNDFTYSLQVDWTGWQQLSVPLNRFQDIGGFIVDPTKVKTLKIHLIDAADSNEKLEVNVDNIRFLEIL